MSWDLKRSLQDGRGLYFLTTDQINRAVKEGLTFEQIKGEAELVLVKKHLPDLISQAAKKYSTIQKDKYIAGRKGLNSNLDGIDVQNDNLKNETDKQYAELIASAAEVKN